MKVVLSEEANKHLKRIPKSAQAKIAKKLRALENNPLAGKKLSGELKDSRSVRAWPYRIIYKINVDEQLVEVSDILHRQVAYK